MGLRHYKRFKIYTDLIQERESIKLKRAAGEKKPWTEDKVLQMYRFTNVRRMDDKVSQWLLKNWFEPYYNHPNMLYAVLAGRFFNLPDALDTITDLVFSDDGWQPELICERLRKRKAGNNRIFNNAYMVRGNDGVDKVETVMGFTIQPMVDDPPKVDRDSMEKTWARLSPRYGMASFMAGQVVADLRWAMEGAWDDKQTWAPAGPGSTRGICWLHNQDLKRNMPQHEFLRDLKEIRTEAEKVLPTSITERLEMMDWQSTLCEFDKYMRVTNGKGRPKQRYPGV